MSEKGDDEGGPDFKDQCRPAGPSPRRAEGSSNPPEAPAKAFRLPNDGGPNFKDQARSVAETAAATAAADVHRPARTQGNVPIISADALMATHNPSAIKRPLILFVDDDSEVTIDLMADLKLKGYDVAHTTSTSSALTLLQHGLEPDFMVTDMGRHEYVSEHHFGFNATAGLLLTEEVRKRGRSTPIIIFSTQDNEERYRNDVARVGGNAIVSDSSDLMSEIARALPMALASVE